MPAVVAVALIGGYHLVEGHTLRPLIYGRALKLSTLAVLISILLGTEVAGCWAVSPRSRSPARSRLSSASSCCSVTSASARSR